MLNELRRDSRISLRMIILDLKRGSLWWRAELRNENYTIIYNIGRAIDVLVVEVC